MSTGPGEETPDEVGGLGEEAAKLLGALSDWAHDRDLGDHVDTGAAECSWCPLCRTLHLVRTPEVREQLAVAATALMQAASAILAAASRPQQPAQPGVEHIDLDGDWPEDEEEE